VRRSNSQQLRRGRRANPWTLIDPTGHWPWDDVNLNPLDAIGSVAKGVGDVAGGAVSFGAGFVEGGVGAVGGAVGGVVGLARSGVDSVGCMANENCRNTTVAAVQSSVTTFMVDPVGNAQKGLGVVGKGIGDTVGSAVDHVTTAVSSGDWHGLGKMAGEVTANVAMTVGLPGSAAGAAGRIGSLAEKAAAMGGVAGRAGDLLGGLRSGLGGILDSVKAFTGRGGRFADDAGGRLGSLCMNSFAPDTAVATAAGSVAIASLAVGDEVTAYDPASGETGPHAVTATFENHDPATVSLSVGGETIETTPEHPFYTTDRACVDAAELTIGEQVARADGSIGTVSAVVVHATPIWL
jgi:hypothetical protein